MEGRLRRLLALGTVLLATLLPSVAAANNTCGASGYAVPSPSLVLPDNGELLLRTFTFQAALKNTGNWQGQPPRTCAEREGEKGRASASGRWCERGQ
jgi:hypothetical protein